MSFSGTEFLRMSERTIFCDERSNSDEQCKIGVVVAETVQVLRMARWLDATRPVLELNRSHRIIVSSGCPHLIRAQFPHPEIVMTRRKGVDRSLAAEELAIHPP